MTWPCTPWCGRSGVRERSPSPRPERRSWWATWTTPRRCAGRSTAPAACFDRVDLELAGDRRTIREVDAAVSDALGIRTTVPESPEEAREGIPPELALYQDYVSTHPYPARPESARTVGLPTTTLHEWIQATF